MAAGRYRHAVTLERRVEAPDAGVGLSTTYEEVDRVWAEIVAVRGSVYAAGMQTGDKITHRITMRHRDMTDFTHVSLGTQRWRVRDCRDPDGRRRQIEAMAEELSPEDRA